MTTITLRAPDSVTALELVQKRLGDDALILSSTWVDGQVEIVATNETPSPPPVPEVPPAPEQPKAPRLVASRDPAPVVLPQFLLRADRPMAPPPSPFSAVLLRQEVLTTRRLVLCGPAGAGKSMAAIQYALLRKTGAVEKPTEFFFIGSGSHSDGALLAQKSHLIGMETRFCPVNDLPDPTPDRVQVVVISARMRDAAMAARAACAERRGAGVIVLPAGMRADVLRSLAAPFRQIAQAAILSQPQFLPPAAADFAALSDLGIPPLWVSAPDLLLGGLDPVPAPPAADQPVPLSKDAEPCR
jgi:hypothetical protein